MHKFRTANIMLKIMQAQASVDQLSKPQVVATVATDSYNAPLTKSFIHLYRTCPGTPFIILSLRSSNTSILII